MSGTSPSPSSWIFTRNSAKEAINMPSRLMLSAARS
jgi:hypothetical protein